MNYCKHLKKRKNKPYCKLMNKEITFSLCRECVNKEYKMIKSANSLQNSATSLHILQNSKSSRISKNVVLQEKKSLKKVKMHNKSKKMKKLEKNRTSVFTNDLEHCYLCGRKKDDLHEIYAGRNRLNSIKYNFVLPLCRECHSQNQNSPVFNDYWHKQGQKYWECNIGSREEFIKVFRRNYLK